MFFLDGHRYLLGAFLLIVANASISVSMVLYNAYLPQIATPEERDAVSSRGWAFGYTSGALVLGPQPDPLHRPRVLRAGGVRRGTDLSGVGGCVVGRVSPYYRCAGCATDGWRRTGMGAVGSGWKQLMATLRDMRPPSADALVPCSPISSTTTGSRRLISQASLYGSEELGLDQSTLIVAVLLVQVLAVAGALGMGRLARLYGAKRTILGSLVVWTAILVAAYLLPSDAPVFFFVLAAAIGLGWAAARPCPVRSSPIWCRAARRRSTSRRTR